MTINDAASLVAQLAEKWRHGLLSKWDFEMEVRAVVAQVVMAASKKDQAHTADNMICACGHSREMHANNCSGERLGSPPRPCRCRAFAELCWKCDLYEAGPLDHLCQQHKQE